MSITREISVLDLSSPHQIDIQAAAREFRLATRDCGFLYVKYNEQKESIVDALRSEQRLFFDLPLQQKQAIAIDHNNRGYLGMGEALMSGATRPDQKEVFFWGRELAENDPEVVSGVPLCGPNQWPHSATFHESVVNYSAFIDSIGALLLRIIATALGAREDFFSPHFERSMLRGQLLSYPPTEPRPDQFGVAPHSDFGCVTLLSQETDGLEVLFPDGRWMPAPPLASTLIVNIGDLLERWSNNLLPSTKHRVRNTSSDPRYSIAMFYDPNPLANIDPMQLLPDQEPLYASVLAADYILSKNRQSFAHYKQSS